MPYGCVNSDTYFTSGINGISARASGLCGRRIGPLHPQSTTAAARNRNPPKAESFVVRRALLEPSGADGKSAPPHSMVNGAAHHAQAFAGNHGQSTKSGTTP